jgi:hypothetical protein
MVFICEKFILHIKIHFSVILTKCVCVCVLEPTPCTNNMNNITLDFFVFFNYIILFGY